MKILNQGWYKEWRMPRTKKKGWKHCLRWFNALRNVLSYTHAYIHTLTHTHTQTHTLKHASEDLSFSMSVPISNLLSKKRKGSFSRLLFFHFKNSSNPFLPNTVCLTDLVQKSEMIIFESFWPLLKQVSILGLWNLITLIE